MYASAPQLLTRNKSLSFELSHQTMFFFCSKDMKKKHEGENKFGDDSSLKKVNAKGPKAILYPRKC